MSKAHDAAAAFSALKWRGQFSLYAEVTESGSLRLYTGYGDDRVTMTIQSSEACPLARWILDTFDEPKNQMYCGYCDGPMPFHRRDCKPLGEGEVKADG